MTPEVMVSVGAPVLAVAAWVINKQLNINKQVAEHTAAIESLKGDISHTRERVDAIYNHLITLRG